MELFRQLTHLLALLLWAAAILAVLAGMPELAVAIVVIVILNAIFAFWQEYRADRSRGAAALPASCEGTGHPQRARRVGGRHRAGARRRRRPDRGDRVAADMRMQGPGDSRSTSRWSPVRAGPSRALQVRT